MLHKAQPSTPSPVSPIVARKPSLADAPTLYRVRATRQAAWTALRAADKVPAQRQHTVAHRRLAEAYNAAERELAILEGRKPDQVFADNWQKRNEAEEADRAKRW